jgi:hypothetical protein
VNPAYVLAAVRMPTHLPADWDGWAVIIFFGILVFLGLLKLLGLR